MIEQENVRWNPQPEYWEFRHDILTDVPARDFDTAYEEMEQQIFAEWLGMVNEECGCCENGDNNKEEFWSFCWVVGAKSCACHQEEVKK